jgi:hypothetical protein
MDPGVEAARHIFLQGEGAGTARNEAEVVGLDVVPIGQWGFVNVEDDGRRLSASAADVGNLVLGRTNRHRRAQDLHCGAAVEEAMKAAFVQSWRRGVVLEKPTTKLAAIRRTSPPTLCCGRTRTGC